MHIADRFGQQGNVDQKEGIRNALQSTAQLLADMIGSNPVLWSPIKDSQATDINIACLFLNRVGCGQVIRQWIGQIARATVFAFNSHGPYPCVYEEYRDLVEHPRGDSEYRIEATVGSVLVPTLAVWAAATNDTETLGLLADFVEGPYNTLPCNFCIQVPTRNPTFIVEAQTMAWLSPSSRLSAHAKKCFPPSSRNAWLIRRSRRYRLSNTVSGR